jgi:tetratricopeptide (TPR) repeat protein
MTTTTRSASGGTGLRRPRAAGILLTAIILIGLTYVASTLRPATQPGGATGAGVPVPVAIGLPGSAADAAATAMTPGSIGQIDRAIKVWAANLAAEPRDFISATTLASLYHARGRLTGDLADHQRALAAARTATEIAPSEPGARGIEAAILYTLHDFAGALDRAKALYRDDPAQLGALATMADAELELGRIADGRADFNRLASRATGPAVDIRLARLAFVTGDMRGALKLARTALATATVAAAAGETTDLGFYQYATGEYARLDGDSSAAAAGYRAALTTRPTDLGALVGLARIDADQGRTPEAIAGLEAAAAIQPQPETLGLLGDLLAASGDVAGANRQFATVRFIEQLGEIQSTVFDRVLIRFELDHGGASETVLAKARASLAGRPDTSGHDAVAWALYRLGRFEEAATEITAARADGAADARLLFHAGAVAIARGDASTGRSLVERAVALGPALDPIELAEARHLLGE